MLKRNVYGLYWSQNVFFFLLCSLHIIAYIRLDLLNNVIIPCFCCSRDKAQQPSGEETRPVGSLASQQDACMIRQVCSEVPVF